MERNSRSDGIPRFSETGGFFAKKRRGGRQGMYHKASKEPEARKGRLQRQRQPFLGDGSSAARREGDRSYTISRDIGFFAFKGQRKGFICHNIQIIPYFLESTENCIK